MLTKKHQNLNKRQQHQELLSKICRWGVECGPRQNFRYTN